jgi:hypothetical protein
VCCSHCPPLPTPFPFQSCLLSAGSALPTNALAVLANMAPHIIGMHSHAATKLMSLFMVTSRGGERRGSSEEGRFVSSGKA